MSLRLSTFAFSGTGDHIKYLWTTYDKTSIHLQTASTTLVFNDDLWSTPGVGDAISAAMQTHSDNYIQNLPPLKLS